MSDSVIIDVTQETFEAEVLEESLKRPVVVDFHAEWCQPCKMLAPLLEKLIKARNGEILLARVDVDKNQALAGYFGVESIPAVKAFYQGQPVLEFTGLLPEAQLNEFLDRLSPSEADRLAQKAATLMESDPEKAESLFREAINHDPNHAPARVGLARLLMEQESVDEIETLLEPVGSEGEIGAEAQRLLSELRLKSLDTGADETELRKKVEAEPENAQARYELGCLLGKSGKQKEALDMLLSAAELDFNLAGTKVREAMVQIFYTLGSNHPLSDEYRSKLSQLLY